MPQALDLVRRELGPDATVLHTRELNGGLLGRVLLGRQYEIAAAPLAAPSNGSRSAAAPPTRCAPPPAAAAAEPPPQSAREYRLRYRDQLQRNAADQISELQTLVAELRRRTENGGPAEMPAAMFDLFT
ncbi:MAG: hypothetical protein AAF961_18815, partial [Planctomycetota bacterium]